MSECLGGVGWAEFLGILEGAGWLGDFAAAGVLTARIPSVCSSQIDAVWEHSEAGWLITREEAFSFCLAALQSG